MTTSKNIISIIFVMFMMGCSYSSLRPEVVDRSDAQRMQTVIFATVVCQDMQNLGVTVKQLKKNLMQRDRGQLRDSKMKLIIVHIPIVIMLFKCYLVKKINS